MKLRKLEEADLVMVLEWRNHPNIRKNMYNSTVITIDEHLTWYQQVYKDTSKQYFVFEDGNIPYGVVAFTQVNFLFSNASWAFYASPSAPIGTGSRMEFLALEYAFNDLNLHKLYCEVISFNQTVIKLHQKFGFQIEGIFKEQICVDKEFHDIYRLAIFSNIWNELSDNFKHKLFRKGR